MLTNEFQFPRKLATQLLHYAQISPETEICGLIGSLNELPVSCYPVDNADRHPETRFLLDPKQQIAAMAAMRQRNEKLFAIYHSHPTAPAMPSKTDIQMATYPDTLYLIISLNTKGVLEMRGFKMRAGLVDEVILTLRQ